MLDRGVFSPPSFFIPYCFPHGAFSPFKFSNLPTCTSLTYGVLPHNVNVFQPLGSMFLLHSICPSHPVQSIKHCFCFSLLIILFLTV